MYNNHCTALEKNELKNATHTLEPRLVSLLLDQSSSHHLVLDPRSGSFDPRVKSAHIHRRPWLASCPSLSERVATAQPQNKLFSVTVMSYTVYTV